jgi:hypothetical protein
VFGEGVGYIGEQEPGGADRGGAPACAANLDRILSVIRAKLPGLRLMGKWLGSAGSRG